MLAIIVSALALVGLIALAGVWLTARRSRAMRRFAADNGFSYMGDTWVLGDCGFHLFRKGNRRRWSNVMSGAWNGTTLVYADYQFTENQGRSAQTYVFSAVVTDLGCTMPEVEVTSRSMLGELADQIDAGGLRFDSEEFDQRFVVSSDDEPFAKELVDGDMRQVLMGTPPELHVHFGPTRMVVWGHRRPPATIGALLDAAAALDHRVPVVVRHERGVAHAVAHTG
ncbi:MAG: hypothetical protein JOZ46_02645 [Candidatus Dormibacteraeota bacterium]|nr:hypothetical protein [Candidatus Dormibacteraeota bacterium]